MDKLSTSNSTQPSNTDDHPALWQTTLNIKGMTCAACSARIEKGLSRMEGVQQANVNLAMEKATISYDPANIGIHDFRNKVEALGFQTVTESVDLNITGMTCAACSARIEKGLSKLPGVSRANVNLALETGHVEYVSGTLKGSDLIHKIRQLGFTAHLKETEEETVSCENRNYSEKMELDSVGYSFSPVIMGDGRSLFIHFLDLGA